MPTVKSVGVTKTVLFFMISHSLEELETGNFVWAHSLLDHFLPLLLSPILNEEVNGEKANNDYQKNVRPERYCK